MNIVEIMEHPVFDALNNVNGGELNMFDLLELTSGYLGLIGNAEWLIESGRKGLPTGI